MIEKIIINNFQKHKFLELDFSQEITTIVGKTDSGKSAIIRALRWATRNDIDGDDFIHWDAKFASVELIVDNKRVIRYKSAKENKYILIDEKGNTKEFKALGRSGVPEEIIALLNISEKNIQTQHDGYFWFFMSSLQVAEQLNEIVDMQIIDFSLSQINSNLKNAKSKTAIYKEILEKEKEELKQFDSLEEIEELYENLERYVKTADDIKNKIINIKELSLKIEENNKIISNKKILIDLYNKLYENKQQENNIDKEKNRLERVLFNINKIKNILDYKPIINDINVLKTINVKIEKNSILKSKLENLIKKIKTNKIIEKEYKNIFPLFLKLEKNISENIKITNKKNTIDNIIKNINNNKNKEKNCDNDFLKLIDNLINNKTKIEKIEKNRKKIKKLIDNIVVNGNLFNENKIVNLKIKKEIEDMTKGECPLCGK